MQKEIDYNRFFNDLNITNNLRVEEDLGNGFVRLKISESDRRQALQDIKSVEDVVIEFLRNSRDASARNIYIASKKVKEKYRKIYIIDDGKGIPSKFHNIIFQSRVTSKLENAVKDEYGFHGRGMALFSIKLNCEKADIVFSRTGQGTCISAEVDLDKVPEKRDQSLLPKISTKNNVFVLTGGTNNIIKILLEFVLQNPLINLYYGSPIQIIAAMINNYNKVSVNNELTGYNNDSLIENVKFSDMDGIEKFFNGNCMKITHLPYLASNPVLLNEVLTRYFDISISLRGLQRIIYKEVESPDPLNLLFSDFKAKTDQNNYPDPGSRDSEKIDIHKKQLKLKLYDENKLANRFKDDEISYIINVLKEELQKMMEKHLIELNDNVEVRKSNNKIIFTVYLEQKK
jgi:hypothetical protein